MANETTTKFKVDISELKKNIQEANRQIRLANAEFKAASAGMDDWSKSADGLTAKIEQQEKVLKSQKTILSDYEKQLVLIEQQYGKGSKEADEMRIKIANQTAAVKNTEKSIQDYQSELKNLDSTLDETEKTVEKTSDGFSVFKGVITDLVAKGIETAISAIKDFAKETIQAGENFEKSMSNVAALSGATGKDFELLSNTAKEMGATTQFSASEAADALGYMALAGWDAKESAEALPGVLNLAGASAMGLAEASDLVTDYMSAFNIATDKSAYFADVLAYAQANANTTTAGLGEAFKNCAANLNASGQDFETVTALISSMANQGLKGSEAGTALAAVMREISQSMESTTYSMKGFTQTASSLSVGLKGDVSKAFSKIGISSDDFTDAIGRSGGNAKILIKNLQEFADDGEDVNKVFSELGLSNKDLEKIMSSITDNMKNFKIAIGETDVTVTDTEGNYRDLTDILADVQKATEGMSDAERSVALQSTFTSRSIKGLNLIFNEGVEKSAAFEEELRKSGGTAEEMSKKMNDNLAGYKKALASKIEGVQIALYERLQPALKKGVEYVSQFVDSVAEKIPEIVDKFEEVLGKIIPVFKAVFGWLIDNKDAVIAAIIGIGTAFAAWKIVSFIQNIGNLGTALKGLWAVLSANPVGLVVSAIAALVAAFVYLWNNSEEFRQFWLDMWDEIQKVASAVVEAVAEFFIGLWDDIKAAWSAVTGFFTGIWDEIKKSASNLVESVANFFSGMWDGLKNGAKAAWEGIKSVFGSIADWFKDKFSKAWQAVKDVFSTGGKIFDGIKDGIVSAFKTVVNAIIRGINKVIALPFDGINSVLEKIKNVSILGYQPFDWIGQLPVPQIPELKRGGILKRGQVGLLEGNGAEAVVPLENNKKWIHSTASDLRRSLAQEGIIGGAGSSNAVTNTYNFNQVNNSPKALSRLEIYRQSKNLLALQGV